MIQKIFVFSMILLVPIFAQTYLSLHGEDIEVRVDTANGYFGIGTYPDGLRLTYDFGDTILPGSNFVLRLHYGDTYGLAGIDTDYEIEEFYAVESPMLIDSLNTIVNTWAIPLDMAGGIILSQYFSIIEEHELGYVELKYVLVNTSAEEQIIEFEHKWDICLDDVEPVFPNDTSVYWNYSSASSYIEYWQYETPDTGIISKIYLDGIDSRRPSRFASGDEGAILASVFDINSSFAGEPYDSLAALLGWGPYDLAPGDSIMITTYYGFGQNRRTMTMPVGWNLVSYPYRDSVTCWTWDNLVGEYIPEPFMFFEQGVGYWVFVDEEHWIYCYDGGFDSYSAMIYRGWNLVGAVDHALSSSALATDPPGLIIEIYAWNPVTNSYTADPDSLLPCRGYWVLSSGSGEINCGP